MGVTEEVGPLEGQGRQQARNRSAALGQRATWGGGTKGSAGGVLASPQDVARARELRAAGKSVRAVAAELGLSKSQVGRLLVAST